MIGDIVPAGVSAAESFGDDPQAVLFPEEAATFVRAGKARRAEFATGRSCARRALASLGVSAVAIPRCPDRGPLWPEGIAGSITHCHGYRAAVVARSSHLLSIGIDAEPHQPLSDRVRKRILSPEEQAWLGDQPPGVHFDRVLFSIKESVFKAWHPVTRRWLGFHDATVTISLGVDTFVVRLLVPAPPRLRHGITGRFRVREGLIVSAATVGQP